MIESKQIDYSDSNFENIYLVGVKLQPGTHRADLYTVVLYNEVGRDDKNRPLMDRDRILFFRDPTQADHALEFGDRAFRKYRPFHGDVAYIYDVPRVLSLISHDELDEQGMLADFLNELFDFVAATQYRLPGNYRKLLDALADVATFDREFGTFLSKVPERRLETCDAMRWCLGAVVSKAALLRD